MIKIMLTSSEWSEVNRLLAAGAHNKIATIKVVRAASRHSTSGTAADGSPTFISGVGLREAKEAVEVLMAELGMTHPDGTQCVAPLNPSARISPLQPIKRIVVDAGSGEVTVDMDEMALKFSEGLTSLPLTDVKRLFDLWQRIKDWEDSAG